MKANEVTKREAALIVAYTEAKEASKQFSEACQFAHKGADRLMGTRTPRFFIWRPTDREPWRVYGTKRHRHPTEMAALFGPHGATIIPAAWEGDDYQAALEECRKMNAERKAAR